MINFYCIPHLPGSPEFPHTNRNGLSNDYATCYGYVITEKLDGIEIAMDHLGFQVSGDPDLAHHPLFDPVRAFHRQFNRYALRYTTHFFQYLPLVRKTRYERQPPLFHLVDLYHQDRWASWGEIEDTARSFQVPTVPLLQERSYIPLKQLQEKTIKLAAEPSCYGGPRQGVCVRLQVGFGNASSCTAQYSQPSPQSSKCYWLEPGFDPRERYFTPPDSTLDDGLPTCYTLR